MSVTAPRKRPTQWERRYGISRAGYDRMLMEQHGVCAICGGTDGTRKLAVDHDHETGRVRGLLCTRCNVGLGYFRDARNVLENAISYLDRAEEVL